MSIYGIIEEAIKTECIMNYLENDYLIPVILGDGKAATVAAQYVFSKTGIRPYIFSVKPSFDQRLLFHGRSIPTGSEYATLTELCSFAEKNDSHGSLLLIYTRENKHFVCKYSDEVESRFVTVCADELINPLEE